MGCTRYGLSEAGHIISTRDPFAHDALAGVREAAAVYERNTLEVWQGARRVARVNLGNAPLCASDRMSL